MVHKCLGYLVEVDLHQTKSMVSPRFALSQHFRLALYRSPSVDGCPAISTPRAQSLQPEGDRGVALGRAVAEVFALASY